MSLPTDAWFRDAVESLDIGVTISDVDGRILYTNPAEAAMHGYKVPELLGRNVRLFGPPRAPKRITRDELRRAGKWERETDNRRRDGTEFPVRLLSDVVRAPGGDPMGVVTICEDLTERREAESRLRQAQKMELLGQLTGGIAHDFNNVLTVVLANLDLLATTDPADWAEIADLVDETRRVARQGAALARQLLGFSRTKTLTFEPVDLEAILDEHLRVIRRVLPESISLDVARDADLPSVYADPHAVQQILLNLVTNARDAMADGGRLGIRVYPDRLDEAFQATHGWGRPGRYVAIRVRDTGSGMDAEAVRQLFEPFFTTKPEGQGTGLGMAMVYSLMKQHRGFVDVVSEPGTGTVITLWFPVGRTTRVPPPRPPAPIREELEARGHEMILVVEDEPPIRRAAQRGLERFGYQVLLAADGKEALEAWRSHRGRIDMIVTDLVMPNMGGRALATALRDAGCSAPILFATGYMDAAGPRGGSDEAPDAFLQKPWTLVDLLRSVRGALDGAPPEGRAP